MNEFINDLKFHLTHIAEVVFGTIDVCGNGDEVVVCLSNITQPNVRMIELECINFAKTYRGYKVIEINEQKHVEIIIKKTEE